MIHLKKSLLLWAQHCWNKTNRGESIWSIGTGRIIHEVELRMGDDPKNRALNSFGQAHECKTCLLWMVVLFVSQADKNQLGQF